MALPPDSLRKEVSAVAFQVSYSRGRPSPHTSLRGSTESTGATARSATDSCRRSTMLAPTTAAANTAPAVPANRSHPIQGFRSIS